MKLLPLITANLKGFIRKRRNIVLLVLFPLLLISVIFLAFNPEGLRKVDVGYVLIGNTTIDEGALENSIGAFADMQQYGNLEQCLNSLRQTTEYVCMQISGTGPYTLTVYYDNTREPVIWEVIERIKQAVQYVQQQQSKEIARDFLSDFNNALSRLNAFDSALSATNQELSKSVSEVDSSTRSLHAARSDLVVTLNQMDSDIAQAKQDTSQARSTKDSYSSSSRNSISALNTPLGYLSTLNGSSPYAQQAYAAQSQAMNQVNLLDSQVESELDQIDAKIASYQSKSAQGREYVGNIDEGLTKLGQTRSALEQYQTKVTATQTELKDIKEEFADLQSLDADTLVNPVVIYNKPAYIPEESLDASRLSGTDAEKAAKGVSLISLQTIFPMILLLITMFLSLLIGSFVALGEVNARTSIRIKLIRGVFFQEFFATFISGIIIVTVPIVVVMFIGESLFKLGIFPSLLSLLLLFALVISYFVLLGMFLAYLVRKESMTLMISTFILVILIFLSGFLLPVERMSPFFAIIAYLNPATVAVSVFKQLVFYDLPIASVSLFYGFLVAEVACLFAACLATKWLRR